MRGGCYDHTHSGEASRVAIAELQPDASALIAEKLALPANREASRLRMEALTAYMETLPARMEALLI